MYNNNSNSNKNRTVIVIEISQIGTELYECPDD